MIIDDLKVIKMTINIIVFAISPLSLAYHIFDNDFLFDPCT